MASITDAFIDPDHAKDFGFAFLSVLFEGLPFIFVGTLISGFIDVYLPSNVIDRFLPKNRWLSILVCGLLGLLVPVCECTVVPVIRRLVAKGLPVGSAFAYMLAAPIVNPITFFSTYTAFGGESLSMALSRMAVGYVVAVLVGVLILFLPLEQILKKGVIARLNFSGRGHSPKKEEDEHHDHDAQGGCCGHSHDEHDHACHSGSHAHDDDSCSGGHTAEPEVSCCGHEGHEHSHSDAGHSHDAEHEHADCCDHDHSHDHHHGGEDRIVGALRTGVKDFMDVAVYFIIGVSLVTILKPALMTQDGFLARFAADSSEFTGSMFMMGLAFILSLCSTSDAFLVATSFDQAFGRVPKMAFMVYGPMMDVKLIFLYQTLMRWKAVLVMAILLFFMVAGACALWGNFYETWVMWGESICSFFSNVWGGVKP